jgi:hypothetical protein
MHITLDIGRSLYDIRLHGHVFVNCDGRGVPISIMKPEDRKIVPEGDMREGLQLWGRGGSLGYDHIPLPAPEHLGAGQVFDSANQPYKSAGHIEGFCGRFPVTRPPPEVVQRTYRRNNRPRRDRRSLSPGPDRRPLSPHHTPRSPPEDLEEGEIVEDKYRASNRRRRSPVRAGRVVKHRSARMEYVNHGPRRIELGGNTTTRGRGPPRSVPDGMSTNSSRNGSGFSSRPFHGEPDDWSYTDYDRGADMMRRDDNYKVPVKRRLRELYEKKEG